MRQAKIHNRYRPAGPDIALIDGLNMVFKAIFTLGTFSYEGQNTTIQYGVLNMIKTMIGETWPRGVVFVMDGKGGKNKRKELYPDYKANRKDKNKDLDWDAIFEQIRSLITVLPKFGIAVADVPCYEADDIIYTIAKEAYKVGDITQIVSSDEDLYQLINESTYCYSISGKNKITSENFKEVVGVPISRYIDYKVLVGDKSDNIKGFSGIGPKTAVSLLNAMTLDEALAQGNLVGRLSVINGGEELVSLNRKLMDISNFAPSYNEIVGNIITDDLDREFVEKQLEEWGFFSMLGEKFPEFYNMFSSLRTKEVLNVFGT